MKLAVPSYVIPADTRENIRFLAERHAQGQLDEVALLCFEPSLPKIDDLLPFKGKWHIHLPYLVPQDFYEIPHAYLTENFVYSEQTQWKDCWKHAKSTRDIEKLAQACINIFKHCSALSPHACVMHLPNKNIRNAVALLDSFLRTWEKELPLSLLCLENVRSASYENYEKLICGSTVSLCFDMAHALTYRQLEILDNKAFTDKIKIVHWSAPFEEDKSEYGKDKHLNLNHLKNQADCCINVIKNTPPEAVHVLELFSWEEIKKSLPFFEQIFSRN